MDKKLLNDRVAVVTGAGRGIGRIIALSLAQEGARVILNDLEEARQQTEQTVKEIIDRGGRALSHLGDVSQFEQARKLIQTAMVKYGRIDILVNNAGIAGHGMPWDISENDWDRMINVHLKGTFNCTRHACGLMKEQQWGRIINCTSGSWISRSGGCHYAAAKAGIVGFTRAVAMDLAEHHVTCNAYHPYARTDMTGPKSVVMVENRFKLGKIDKEEYEWQRNPPGPEGIGPFVCYLSSEEASYINGKIFYVSGGKIGIYAEPVRKKTLLKEGGIWEVKELVEIMPQLLGES